MGAIATVLRLRRFQPTESQQEIEAIPILANLLISSRLRDRNPGASRCEEGRIVSVSAIVL